MSDIPSLLAQTAYKVERPAAFKCAPDFSVQGRVFQDYDFWYVGRGRGKIGINGVVHEARADRLFLFQPGDRVDIRPHGRALLSGWLCHFSPLGEPPRFVQRLVLSPITDFAHGRLRPIFAEAAEKADDPLERTLFVLRALRELHRAGSLRMNAASPMEDERLAAMARYVKTHLASPLRVGDLAQLVGMDRSSVTRLFARQWRTTPHAWVRERRLAEAKRLLATSLPIHEIATRTGFPDSPTFIKAFRRATRLTPGMWRREGEGFPL